MSGWGFAAAVIQTVVSWPVAAVIIATVFRKKIKGLLSTPMKHMKIGPFDAEWDRVVATTEAKADLTPPPLESPPRQGDDGYAELRRLARLAPMDAVLRAYNKLESELRRVVEEKVGPGQVDKAGAGRLAAQARDLGLIDDRWVEAIQGMTVLRNLAAHGRGDVSVEKALDYVSLVDAVMYELWTRSPAGERVRRAVDATLAKSERPAGSSSL